MSNQSGQAGTQLAAEASTEWYRLSDQAAASALDVDPAQGLSAAEATSRLNQYGPNVLSDTKTEPRWRAFLRQYKDYMQIILLAAAAVSILIGDTSTAALLFVLTIFNAVLGLRQESKAADALSSLRQMMEVTVVGLTKCRPKSWSRAISYSLRRATGYRPMVA
jgi:Ca2+-transporting ATPase